MKNTVANNYNSEAFTPEEVEKRLHLKLINLLLDLNKDLNNGYYDIHISFDSECTIVDWKYCNFELDDPAFQYVAEDEEVVKIIHLPDGTYTYAADIETGRKLVQDFLENNPEYKESN